MPSRTLAALMLLALTACQRETARTAEETPEPMRVTPGEFRSLTWLEGRWRGTLNDTAPFYEGYRFVDDSTLRSVTYADSMGRQVSDSGQITLRGGHIMSGDSARGYVVTALDSSSVHFKPVGAARNAFTWRRESDGTWTATLTWRDASGRPAERVYVMRPLGRLPVQ